MSLRINPAAIGTVIQALAPLSVKHSSLTTPATGASLASQSHESIRQIELLKKQLLNPPVTFSILSKTITAPTRESASYTYESTKASLAAITGWNLAVTLSGNSIFITALRQKS